jgi:hypothetical protein
MTKRKYSEVEMIGALKQMEAGRRWRESWACRSIPSTRGKPSTGDDGRNVISSRCGDFRWPCRAECRLELPIQLPPELPLRIQLVAMADEYSAGSRKPLLDLLP